MNPRMGRPVLNKHGVNKTQWARWSNHARGVFNRMYDALRPSNQPLWHHPKAAMLSHTHWRTLRHNVAWEAACAADHTSHIAKLKAK